MVVTTHFRNWLTKERVLELADEEIRKKCLPPEPLTLGIPIPGPGYRCLGLYFTDQPYYQVSIKYSSRFNTKNIVHRGERHKGYDYIEKRNVDAKIDVSYDEERSHSHRDSFGIMIPANLPSSPYGKEFVNNTLAFRGERTSYRANTTVARKYQPLFRHPFDQVWHANGQAYAASIIQSQLENAAGYYQLVGSSIQSKIDPKLVAHVIAPLWCVIFQVRDHIYFVCINGQNGNIVAHHLPKSLELPPRDQQIEDLTIYAMGGILLTLLLTIFSVAFLWLLIVPGLLLLYLWNIKTERIEMQRGEITVLLRALGLETSINLLEDGN